MADTSFSVPDEKQSRLTTAYAPDPVRDTLTVLDPPSGGWWNEPPAMANLAGMLVSTLDDVWAFVAMVRAGGVHHGERVQSDAAVRAVTSDHLTEKQRAPNALFLGPHGEWGYGMAAPGPLKGDPPIPGGSAGTVERGRLGAPTPCMG